MGHFGDGITVYRARLAERNFILEMRLGPSSQADGHKTARLGGAARYISGILKVLIKMASAIV
jgi:hypothetical protein